MADSCGDNVAVNASVRRVAQPFEHPGGDHRSSNDWPAATLRTLSISSAPRTSFNT